MKIRINDLELHGSRQCGENIPLRTRNVKEINDLLLRVGIRIDNDTWSSICFVDTDSNRMLRDTGSYDLNDRTIFEWIEYAEWIRRELL